MITIKIQIPWKEEDGNSSVRWVAPDLKLVVSESEAVTLRFRNKKIKDRLLIEQEAHEIVGGLARFVDLEKGVAVTRRFLEQMAKDALWPDGMPEIAPEDAQNQILLWHAANQNNEQIGLQRMLAILDDALFYAEWKVLIQDAPAKWANPSDWEDFGNAPLILMAAENAYTKARQEQQAGKK